MPLRWMTVENTGIKQCKEQCKEKGCWVQGSKAGLSLWVNQPEQQRNSIRVGLYDQHKLIWACAVAERWWQVWTLATSGYAGRWGNWSICKLTWQQVAAFYPSWLCNAAKSTPTWALTERGHHLQQHRRIRGAWADQETTPAGILFLQPFHRT